ncbi:putative phage baseplate assembly protein [Kibdelosporangium banguiense]|uniref:Phage baseplate assembly protein n=1 Tax=Kibdelosporangium banguiense TaxID=1365924 RepID=A0ABS4U167_9PSEU|nr:putative baseplate assembly protein [Kibdelosporangium banguiense]MBP2330397.1 putative phage baseplate assembly protein [Kibdelosporangium banguiense]
MTLPAPKLDDLTWADMMAAIRRRIPAESGGTWTLHAPSDPGVTLLELFAYLLEQRLYWLDQVPDALVVAILRLLGIQTPRPAQAAATVLQLTAGAEVVSVPQGTVMSRDPSGRMTFTLENDVTILPLDGEVSVWTDRDRTADLRARRGVPLLTSDGSAAEARFTLPLKGSHAVTGWLSLLLELDVPAAAPPSWSPRAVKNVGAPADLTWSYFRPGQDAQPFAEVEDGTAGLRRSGIVRLRLPDGWTTENRGLLVSTRAATFSASPRLLQVAVNVSAARNIEKRVATCADLEDQISKWLKLPGQYLVLPDAVGRLLNARLVLAGEKWDQVADFTFGASADRTFVVDRTEGALVFGDGLTGRIPHQAERVSVNYTIGGGRAGNGGLTGNWLPVDFPVALAGANLVQADGGEDPETVAQARERAAGSLGEVTRAVTADDYVTLAQTTPGVAVARAYASLGEHPGFPCTPVPGAVTVHIVPSVPRDDFDREDFVAAPKPDPAMLCEVADRLAEARLLTSEVFVRAPAYRAVTLRVDLSGNPADRSRVSTVVSLALRRYLDPLVGGDDEAGWPFGEPLRPSALLRAAQRALGDLADVAAVAISLDGPDEECRDVPLRAGELPVVKSVRTRIIPAVEPGEGLT